ncbi:hypothetical protein SCHPADRAFT_1001389, partial [Schizopora paradoxa]
MEEAIEKYGLKIWEHPDLIDAYCENGADVVLNCIDTMFKYLFTVIEGSHKKIQTLDTSKVVSTIEAYRLGIEKIDHLTRLNDMQLDIMRRTMEKRHEYSKALINDRSSMLSQLDLITPKRLPQLPNEIIAQIFRRLYLDDSWFNRNTTIGHFIADNGTPEDWKNLVRREVPVVMVEDGSVNSCLFFSREEAQDVIGFRPTIVSPLSEESILSGSQVTVWVDPTLWPKFSEQLHNARQWDNLFIESSGYRVTSQSRTAMMNDLIQKFGNKLAGIRQLFIYLEDDDSGESDRHLSSWYTSAAEDNSYSTLSTPCLRVARVPFPLIPGLRQFLSQITDLEFTIPGNSLRTNFNVVVDVLRSHADTIVCLKISDEARLSSWNMQSDDEDDDTKLPLVPRGERHVVLFSRLKRLVLQKFPERVLLDALTAFDCPVISSVSVEMGIYRPWPLQVGNQEDSKQFSANFLQAAFPSVECVAVKLFSYKKDLLFFEDFAKPDGNGMWLFPHLTTLEFGDMPPHFMKTLLDISRGQSARFCRDSGPILVVILRRFSSRIVAESRGHADHPTPHPDSARDSSSRYELPFCVSRICFSA